MMKMNKKGVTGYFTWGIYLLLIFILFSTALFLTNFYRIDYDTFKAPHEEFAYDQIIRDWNELKVNHSTVYEKINVHLNNQIGRSEIEAILLDYLKKIEFNQDNVFMLKYQNSILLCSGCDDDFLLNEELLYTKEIKHYIYANNKPEEVNLQYEIWKKS